MDDRSKIMAGFANLEADMKRYFGQLVNDKTGPAFSVLRRVELVHTRFLVITRALPEPEAEAVEISVDPAVGHVEG